MTEYIYMAIIIFFVLILLVVAKVEDGEDMNHKEKEDT